MGKLVPILAIIGGVMGLLTALVLVADTPAPLVGTGFALVAGILLVVKRGLPYRVGGAVGIVLALIGVLGVIGSFSTGGAEGEESSSLDLGVSATLGLAFTFSACLAPALALVWGRWGEEAPWVDYILAGVLGFAVLLALVLNGHLNDQTRPGGFIVALLGLGASITVGVLALREG